MSLKKKMGAALATTALGAALIGGGTFAIFTDSAQNANNTFAAGTVDINVTDTSSFTGAKHVNISNLAPGDEGSREFTVKNDGSLDLKYDVEKALTGTLVKGNQTMDLAVTIEKKGANDTWTVVDPQGTNWIPLAAGATDTYRISYKLPLAADNTYESGSADLQYTFNAQQLRNNQ